MTHRARRGALSRQRQRERRDERFRTDKVNPWVEQAQSEPEGRPGPCGKMAYSSRKEANKGLARLVRTRALQGRSDDIECRAYGPCHMDLCRQSGREIWHLTSRAT